MTSALLLAASALISWRLALSSSGRDFSSMISIVS